jgi:pimeloyl-ACP methyl ester carboxylesterase
MQADTLTLDGHRHGYHWQHPEPARTQPLIALHGFGTTGYRTFRHVAPQLNAAGVPLYAPDLLGFGASDKPPDGYSLGRYAALTRAFARALNLEHPVLVGHSMGGKIAAATVALYPDAFSGLILINPGGFSRYSRLMAPVAEAAWTHWLFRQRWFLQYVLPRTPLGLVLNDIESLQQFYRFRFAHRPLDLDHAGLREPLRHADVPSLVVWGRNDPILPFSTTRRVLRDLRDARLVVIPDAGHAPMKDQPGRTAEAIVDFLRNLA